MTIPRPNSQISTEVRSLEIGDVIAFPWDCYTILQHLLKRGWKGTKVFELHERYGLPPKIEIRRVA